MDKELLKRIKDVQKLPDGPWATEFSFKFSLYFTYFFARVGATPNFVSILSFFVAACSALCFLSGNYYALLVGAVVWQISTILDCADGDLARSTKQTSLLGLWLDKSLDRLKEFMMFGCITYGVYSNYVAKKNVLIPFFADSPMLILLLGFAVLMFVNVSEYMSDLSGLIKPSERAAKAVLFGRYILSVVDFNSFMISFFAVINRFDLLLVMYLFVFFLMFPYQLLKSVRNLKR